MNALMAEVAAAREAMRMNSRWRSRPGVGDTAAHAAWRLLDAVDALLGRDAEPSPGLEVKVHICTRCGQTAEQAALESNGTRTRDDAKAATAGIEDGVLYVVPHKDDCVMLDAKTRLRLVESAARAAGL